MSGATGWLDSFKEIVNGGEPALREWLLLRSFTPVLVITSFYALFVKVLGPAYMANRKPIKPIYLVSAYNFALVFFYISFIVRGVMCIPKMGSNFFCGSLSRQSALKSPYAFKLYELGHELYIVKYIELFDTVFLVLSKKFNMITNLHVFHHAVIPIFGFVGFRSETQSYLTFYMGMNSLIHIAMYTYYGIAILGPKYQKYLWWKKYLTFLQILQFFIATVYIAFMSAIGCTDSKTTLYFSSTISVIFFILFINYYKKMSVKTKSKQHSPSDDTRKSSNGFIQKPGDEISQPNGSLSPLSKKLSSISLELRKTSQQCSENAAKSHEDTNMISDKEKHQ